MQMKIYTMHKKKHYFRKENRSGPGPDLDRPQGPGQEVAGPGPLYRGPGQRSLARTLGPPFAVRSGPRSVRVRTGLRTVYAALEVRKFGSSKYKSHRRIPEHVGAFD